MNQKNRGNLILYAFYAALLALMIRDAGRNSVTRLFETFRK